MRSVYGDSGLLGSMGSGIFGGGLLAASAPSPFMLNQQAQWRDPQTYFAMQEVTSLRERNQRLQEENERLKNRVRELEHPVLPPIERTKRYRKYT